MQNYECAMCAHTKQSTDEIGTGDFAGWATVSLSTTPIVTKVLCGLCTPIIRHMLGGPTRAQVIDA